MSGVEAGAGTKRGLASPPGFTPATGEANGQPLLTTPQPSLRPAAPNGGRPVSAPPLPERRRAPRSPRAQLYVTVSHRSVEAMRALPGAIGFMPLGEALLHGDQAVTLDGVAPTAPEYELTIGLGSVYPKPRPPRYHAFLDYLESPRARKIMRETGHAPVVEG